MPKSDAKQDEKQADAQEKDQAAGTVSQDAESIEERKTSADEKQADPGDDPALDFSNDPKPSHPRPAGRSITKGDDPRDDSTDPNNLPIPSKQDEQKLDPPNVDPASRRQASRGLYADARDLRDDLLDLVNDAREAGANELGDVAKRAYQAFDHPSFTDLEAKNRA